mmetsp:Transcript_14912/g.22696  ORF Transcript_14912/g.22696 Transcript_14912/m.22696 type:complete len:262 (-) Transcript_14912:44-829(-)
MLPMNGASGGKLQQHNVEDWFKVFALNRADAKETSSDLRVLILGDSITEQWRGSDLGHKLAPDTSAANDYIEVYEELFRIDRSGLALGIGGDRIPQLLYRIQHGEIPIVRNKDHWVVWLLIGTNDLSDACSKEAVLVGIINLVEVLQSMLAQQADNKVTIVMNGILPRGNDPFYSEYISWINERLECYSKTDKSSYPNIRIQYYDTTKMFLLEDKTNDVGTNDLDLTLMPDYLHPSPVGQEKWGRFIKEKVEEICGVETLN